LTLSIRQRLLRAAIQRTLKRRAPGRFSYSNDNNFFVPVIRPSADAQNILIDELNQNTIIGREWTESKFETPVKCEIQTTSKFSFEATHFYGWAQIRYDSLFEFWKGQFSLLAQRKWLSEKFRQSRFNAVTRFRHDRMDVLKKLVEMHLKKAVEQEPLLFVDDNGQSVVALMERVYSQRVFGHPSYNEESARFRLIIESLAETKDLVQKDKHTFRLSPQSLATIANYEQTERRHQDSLRQSRRLLLLTVVLAAAAVAQVLIST
jgi:hypothetical protein